MALRDSMIFSLYDEFSKHHDPDESARILYGAQSNRLSDAHGQDPGPYILSACFFIALGFFFVIGSLRILIYVLRHFVRVSGDLPRDVQREHFRATILGRFTWKLIIILEWVNFVELVLLTPLSGVVSQC